MLCWSLGLHFLKFLFFGPVCLALCLCFVGADVLAVLILVRNNETGQIAILSVTEMKDDWISFQSNTIVHSNFLLANSAWVTFGKRATKQPLCGLVEGSWHILLYTVYVTLLYVYFENC